MARKVVDVCIVVERMHEKKSTMRRPERKRREWRSISNIEAFDFKDWCNVV
jgi:hypothetical protein